MDSSAYIKTCGICSMKAGTYSGMSGYTAECSHTFHFNCIQSYAQNQYGVCPVCQAKWINPPLVGRFPPPALSNASSNPANPFDTSTNALNPPAVAYNAPVYPFPGCTNIFNPPNAYPFDASTNAFNPPAVTFSFGTSGYNFNPATNPLLTNPNNTSQSYNPMLSPTPSPFSFHSPQFPTFEPPQPSHFSDDDPVLAANTDVKETSSVLLSIKCTPERPAVAASESISQFPVLVGLRAPLISNDTVLNRAPVDLVAVLDVSGSMLGSKLELVKQAVLFVIDNLGSSDRLSIVSFSDQAKRISRLTRMTESGREDAKHAVNSLCIDGGTNIVEGLKMGVRVLEERHEKNPVSSIVFLSDGEDTYHRAMGGGLFGLRSRGKAPTYLHLLPPSICARNRTTSNNFQQQQETFPVHAFGFGSDHDAMAMHAISDSSNGTFSYIESLEMVQDAFANCIGGLLSVVIQDLKLTARAASHGVEIKSIPSGRYASKISNQESEGIIDVGDMYAEEEREFLIYLSIPEFINATEDQKMSLLDITCSYKDVISEKIIQMDADLVEIRRPKSLSDQDTKVHIDVDRQRNRVLVAESMAEAQRKAESGDMAGAQSVLANRRAEVLKSVSGVVGDSLCRWLEAEMKDLQERMSTRRMYEESGRAFAFAGMSSHATQRATTRGHMVPGAFLDMELSCAAGGSSFGYASAAPVFGASAFGSAQVSSDTCSGYGTALMARAGPQQSFGSAASPRVFGGYATRSMANMVGKSKAQQQNKNYTD